MEGNCTNSVSFIDKATLQVNSLEVVTVHRLQKKTITRARTVSNSNLESLKNYKTEDGYFSKLQKKHNIDVIL